MNASDLCEKLSDFFEKNPNLWWSGTSIRSFDPGQQECLLTGLYTIGKGEPEIVRESQRLLREAILRNPFIIKDYRGNSRSISSYNDASGRTVEDIITILRTA